ncbi:von Willebrand factor type A domain-containing protein [Clostridium sporogenes]|uniref:vWA domain-containing protein n=1 Tax=Clostridium botulinum TaxID=1491 RepID=UPI00071770EF|nr:vWA domain-containing protein [Clostridium botulinum]KRU27421.1 von Willebrand factor type A domain-containing protein [Clostridium sporogenes]KRU27819.1 von Willebrand factor type A domain-containing protein [Clostridium sporogenes]KRU32183.1 von Willebrand factor type A domain-containing protein [Clostridium sporogenes]KRU45047.1 von Willebrand factor type A domain-containing protein [Clostridium sporogenes]MBZ1330273.1 VWA domain-containing protein [Clostridium botulinum]
MFDFDEQTLIEESKKHCEEFLQKEQRSLATFTGDSSLMYIPDSKLQRFILDSSKGVLYLPLESFLDRKLDDTQIMWHIYYELALYPDWKKQTKKYLNRKKDWQKEIDHMTSYIMTRIKKEGLENDSAYQPKVISNYVRKEILDLLHLLDKQTSFLRVLQMCPIYRDEENFKKIVSYMKKTGKTIESISQMPRHRAFANSFFIIELYKIEPKIEECAQNPFDRKIFNQPFFDFIHYQLVKQINKDQGIIERDPFIRSFIFPTFEQLWKQEIDEMMLYKSKGQKEEQVKGSENLFEQSKADEVPDSLESTQEEVEKILEEMLDQEDQISTSIQNAMQGKVDLEAYGISQSDQQLFQFYSNKMKLEREQMRQFWKKLIGDAKKEVSVKKDGQVKGKLDVDSFINFYPDFVEAQKKGNYKNLPIFNRYLLETQADILPERIEISFVIDNSGSMNESKIEASRKALAVTLLSIDDFNKYLKSNAEQLNQKVEVLSETWFFGSKYYNVKEFNDKNVKEKEKSDIIRSIVKLDATDGATDDASCLREISNRMTSIQESELKKGKQIKIVFEITDGASSFPGSAKEAVQELLSKNVEVYAFQIGKNSETNEKIFNFVWNEGYKQPHGVMIGEQVEKLPKELLKAVGKNMQSIFNN